MTDVSPPWSRLITDAGFRMSGCKITRPRLDKIWNLAKEGFSSEALIRITTERKAGELSSEVEGNTIDAVIEAVRNATLPGDPDYIDNLRLCISEQGSVRSVSIVIGGRLLGPRVTVSVKDENPGWVRGRVGGLRDLFAETRTEWFVGHGRTRFLTALFGFFWACALNIVLSHLPFYGHDLMAEILLFAGDFAVLTGVGYIAGSWMDHRSWSELWLEHRPRRRTIDLGVLTLIVAIIGVVVTIISALAAHHAIPTVHLSERARQEPKPVPVVLPLAEPGLGLSWAQAGVSWARGGVSWAEAASGTLPACSGAPAGPGAGVGWAQAGVSWAAGTSPVTRPPCR